MAWTSDIAEQTVRSLLADVRRNVKINRLTKSPLPGWVHTAAIQIGWVNDTLIFLATDARGAAAEDQIQVIGPVAADSAILLGEKDLAPKAASRSVHDGEHPLILCSAGDRSSMPPLTLVDPSQAFLDCGLSSQPHAAVLIFDLDFRRKPKPADSQPARRRRIPLAIYIRQIDLGNSQRMTLLHAEILDRLQNPIPQPVGPA